MDDRLEAAKPKIFLVEDQPLTLVGIKMALNDLAKFEIVGEATDGAEAIESVIRTRPDVVLMDVIIPGVDGIEAASQIKKSLPGTRIVMFTSFGTSEVISAALAVGADGYLLKNRSVEQIAHAIETVMRGNVLLDPAVAERIIRDLQSKSLSDVKLSPLEIQILNYIRDGYKNDKIASALGTSEDAVAAALRELIRAYCNPQQIYGFDDSATQNMGESNSSRTEPGQIFENKYRIEKELGVGGAGKVYAAEHVFIARPVALKIMHKNLLMDTIMMNSFRQEAIAIACLDHPNVIRLYDFGVSVQQEPFLVMELFDGENLRDILDRQTYLNTAEFCEIFSQICRALSAAHAKNLIHCDIKPSNILVRRTDSGIVAKLVDFGLAKSIAVEKANSKSPEGLVSGTAPYMSPEQCTGDILDERTDIYSLGCVMFEAISGEQVFGGLNIFDIFNQHANSPAPKLKDKAPHRIFPNTLEECIAKMLQKAPEDRVATASLVQEYIEQVQKEIEQ